MAQKTVSVRLSVEADNLDGIRKKLEELGATVKTVGNDNSADKLRRSLEGLEGRLDPAARAAQRLARDTETLNKSLAEGAVSQERHNVLLARAQQASVQAAAGMTSAAGAAGSFRGVMGNLGAQIQDVTVQAQMGTSAFIILAQQGPQIASAFGPVGAVIGAVIAISSVAAGAVYGMSASADAAKTAFTDYATAMDVAVKAAAAIQGASVNTRAALEAERRSVIAARQEVLKKAEADLVAAQAADASARNDLGARRALGAGTLDDVVEQRRKRVSDLRKDLLVLQGSYGEFSDGARQAVIETERSGKVTTDYAGNIRNLNEELRNQITELGFQVKAQDLSSAAKLRAKLQSDAMAKSGVAEYSAVNAGTRALIDQAVAQQESIDKMQDDEKASNKAASAAETLAKSRTKLIGELDRDIDAQKRLAEIAGMGAAEQRAANEATRVAAELAKAHTTESTAEGKAIAAKVKEAERWKAIAADTKTLDVAKANLKYAQDELALNDLLPGARERAARSLQIQREATVQWGEATSDVKSKWIGLQEQIADTQSFKKFQDDVLNVSKDIGKDVSTNLWDQFTGEAKAQDALTVFKNLFKRIAIEALNANIILPITTSVVGSVPQLFGIGGSSNQSPLAGQAANQNGGVGSILSAGSLLSDLFPSAGSVGIGQSIVSGASGLAFDLTGSAGFSQALGLGIEASPWGIVGGLGASLLGLGGKGGIGGAVGGTLGSVAGGAVGSTALGSLLGSAGGPVGAIVGSFLGTALGGAFGPKPSVGPNAQGNVVVENGRFVEGPSAADNGGDVGPVKQATAQIAAQFNALIDSFGLKTTGQNFGFFTGGDKVTGNGVKSVEDLVKAITAGGVTGSGLVGQALTSDKVKGLTNPQDIAGYLQLAKSIEDATAGLASLDKSLAGIAASAKKAAGDTYKAVDDELAKAADIGLGDQYKAALTGQIRSTFEGAAQSWTPMETAMQQVQGQTDALVEAVGRWGLAITESEVRADAAAKVAALRKQALTEYDAALATAQGRDYITQLGAIRDSEDMVRRNLAAVGVVDAANKAATLVAEQAKSVLRGLDSTQLADVAATLTGSMHDLAAGMLTAVNSATAAQAAAQAASYSADIQTRMLTAVGNMRGAGLTALDAQQAAALAQARASGYDVTQLQQVQAAERAAQAFTLAQQDVTGALEQRISAEQALATSLQNGAVAAAQAARSFRQAFDQLALNDNSPLSPLAKLEEARRQFEADYATLGSSTANDNDKAAARQDIQSLGPTLIGLARGYFASSSTTDYDRVRAVYAEFGDLQSQGLDTADQQLAATNRTIAELQRQRSDAAAIGQRNYGGLTDLKSVMDQSLAVWQAALIPLQSLTGTTSNTPHYAAPAAVQVGWDGLSGDQQHGIARAMGWGGTLDQAFNIWLATDTGRASTFGADVTTIASGQRYGSPEDVQRAWDALSSAQQMAAVRTAGYDGGIDAGLNAWVKLGHQAAFEAAVRGQAHSAGVPGFAMGGVVPHLAGSTLGQDSVFARLTPHEGVVNLRGMGVLGADGLAALNAGRPPANDRWGGNVAEYRGAARQGVADNGAAAIVAALREEIRSLKSEMRSLRTVAAQGHIGTKQAIESGNEHAAEMAQEARLRRSAPRSARG
jgi:trimeric autotransporter adhesin